MTQQEKDLLLQIMDDYSRELEEDGFHYTEIQNVDELFTPGQLLVISQFAHLYHIINK